MTGYLDPKVEEIIESWRELHNEQHHNFHTSLNTINKIKPMWKSWAGYVACMEEYKQYTQSFGRKIQMNEASWKTITSFFKILYNSCFITHPTI
jgi:hypothetical protein